MPDQPTGSERRWFLRRSTQLIICGASLPLAARTASASTPQARRGLQLNHTHTGETLSLVYAVGKQYVPQAISSINHFLRDHYSGDVGEIDPQLLDLMFEVRLTLGTELPFHVISGYRCPDTNARLRKTGGGGVAKRSLHMLGKAIDIRLPGVPLTELRDAALSLKNGGVGTYTRDQFVHIDTGRTRSW